MKKKKKKKKAPPTYNNGDVVECPCVFVDIYLNVKIKL